MSRIGKQPIEIPEGVEITVLTPSGGKQEVKVKGPKGEVSSFLSDILDIKVKDKKVTVNLKSKFEKYQAVWGTSRSIIANMIEGVVKEFEKQLEISGTGYKVNLQGNKLVMSLGFSHPVEVEAPKGIEFKVEKNIITVSGVDKQLVGETAAQIRKKKKVEPYKGKGIKYVDEFVRRKEGKKAVGEGAA